MMTLAVRGLMRHVVKVVGKGRARPGVCSHSEHWGELEVLDQRQGWWRQIWLRSA